MITPEQAEAFVRGHYPWVAARDRVAHRLLSRMDE